jgi:hypothetical protein
MTPGERSLWRAVYAASWHQSTGAPMGAVTDEMRAEWCAQQATRAVNALTKLYGVGIAVDYTVATLCEVLG